MNEVVIFWKTDEAPSIYTMSDESHALWLLEVLRRDKEREDSKIRRLIFNRTAKTSEEF
jgi:hypothetical protein